MDTFWVLIILGIIFILVGGLYLIKVVQVDRRCIAITTGYIVEVKREPCNVDEGIQEYYLYLPIYEYTVEGQKLRRKGEKPDSSEKRYQIGDSVEIRYNPDNPIECIVEEKNNL